MGTFTKAERLCSKVLIDGLVKNGRSFVFAPFRLTWLVANESPAPAQVMFSVPKRKFKRAVDRNLLKRRMREAYRKQKGTLYEELGSRKIALMIVYTSGEIMEYKAIEEKISGMLKRLSAQINSIEK